MFLVFESFHGESTEEAMGASAVVAKGVSMP